MFSFMNQIIELIKFTSNYNNSYQVMETGILMKDSTQSFVIPSLSDKETGNPEASKF